MPTYPTINGGVRTQRPWTKKRDFGTSVNDMPGGWKYAYGWRGTGLSGFPTDALPSFEINYPSITTAELATIKTHFDAVKGRWDTFDMIDPEDGVTSIANCRYGMDRMEISYPQRGQVALRVVIEEFNP
jgi:hypothetical protein